MGRSVAASASVRGLREQVGPVSVREVKTCDMVAQQGAD
jgi:hypothetical protein